MKGTEFIFFKNTPLTNFQNTIHFKSNQERDTFFLEGGHYPTLTNQTGVEFNFIRDRSEIVIKEDYNNMRGVNYCTFLSEFENIRYYAYVIKYEWYGDGVVRVFLLIDGIMTYTQGNVLERLPNLDIKRQHLTKTQYNTRIFELKNNNDVIKTYTKNYFKTDELLFDELIVLISSSVTLKGNFGSVDKPKMRTASGKQFDKVTSPLNLYACDMDNFNKLMDKLSDYPWIAQNIKSMSLIPKIFMEDNLTLVDFSSGDSLSSVDYLYRISGSVTNTHTLNSELEKKSYSPNQLMELFGLDKENEKHLLRNEYTTTELYNYSGGQFFIDNGLLNREQGLSFIGNIITGHTNELKVFVNKYRSEFMGNKGSHYNDCIVVDQFDDVPMLIDTYNLALSKSANQRALAESKLVTNRAGNLFSGDTSPKDKFFDAMSLASNLSPGNLFGKFNDEHEFYRSQQAEFKDMALEPSSVTTQTTGNSFNIANRNFGIHFKFSKPSNSEMRKIRKYYRMFGYEINDSSSYLDNVHSMSICNYVQFSGSWFIPYADVSVNEMMKAQFENGVRLWHNNGTPDPTKQNVLENNMVL